MQYLLKKISNKVALLFLFILISGTLLGVSKPEFRRVLLIHSYTYSFPPTANMINGLHSVFDTCNVKLDVEFMDWKRFPNEKNENAFFNSISVKIGNENNYDAIVTSDDAALHFVLKHQNDLFKNVPIVFSGVNDVQLAIQQNRNDWVTGVVESVSMKENVDLMLNMFPDSKKFYCIVDNTISGQSDLRLLKSLMQQYNDITFEVIDISQVSFNRLPGILKKIQSTRPVLLLSAYNDVNNKSMEFEDSFAHVKNNLKAPVFHLWYHGMGTGVLGGKLFSHKESSIMAAKMVLQILNGKPVKNIPVITESPNKYVFDYKELVRFNIDSSQLPENARIINKPNRFYEINKGVIFFIVIFLIFQGLLFFYLIHSNIQRKKAEQKMQQKADEYYRLNEEYAALNEELLASIEEVERKSKDIEDKEELYRLTLEAANDGYWDWDLTNNQVFFSSRWKEILGYKDYELKNEFDTWRDNVHEDDVNEVLLKVENYIAGKDDRYEVEFRMRHKQGYYVHILAKGLLMRDDDGGVYRIIGTHQDLTERYKHEHNLKKQVEENLSLYEQYRAISDELFVKNNELLATEEELRANNKELYLKNEKVILSEERYRMLFENMTESFALHEIVLDKDNKPVDYIFRDVNPLFLKRINMKYEEVVNKTALSLFPDTEKVWIETFGEVALTGEPKFIKDYSKELDHYYETTIFCPKPMFFAAIFKDVTDETRANLKLQESHRQLKVKERLFQDMFNSSPVVMMILNKQANIVEINQSGQSLIKESVANTDQEQPGNMLSCINSFLHPKGCGHSKLCNTCVLRNSISETVNLRESIYKKEFELFRQSENGRKEKSTWLVSTSPLFDSDEEKILVCMEDVSTLKEKELQLVKRNNEINQLLNGAKGILATNDFNTTTYDLFKSCLNISGASCGFVGMRKDAGTDILFLSVEGKEIKEENLTIPENEWFSQVYQKNKVVIINSCLNKCLPEQHCEINNAIFAPIVVGNRAEGVFVMANKREDFNQGDANVITAFTELVALSLHNSRTNSKLEESEARFRKAFLTSPDSISISKLDGTFVNVNNGFTQIMGYEEQEVIGRSSRELSIWVNENDKDKLFEGLKKNGSVSNIETHFRAKNGSVITGLLSANLININNEPHILTITRDIDQLKLQKYYLEKAQEIGNIGSWSYSVNNKNFTLSEQSCQIYGFGNNDSVKLTNLQSLIHTDDKARMNKLWEKCLSGQPYDAEFRIIVNNTVKWVHEITGVERVLDSKPRIIAVVKDVTAKKNTEWEMNQVNKRFEGLENIISYKAHSIPDLLDHTLNNVLSYTDSDFGAVYHYDKSKKIFYLNNYSDAVSLTLDALVENNKINCLGKAVKTKKPVILNEEGNNYSFLNKKNQQNIKSLTIPILVNNDVTAVFWVANHKHDYHSFHAKQVMLLLETTWIIVEKQKLQEESGDNII